MENLVIGYGNTLRSDDGVGSAVAEQVAEWNLDQVRSIATHQLTPELALEIAQSQRVIFVDAMAIAQTPFRSSSAEESSAEESSAEESQNQVRWIEISANRYSQTEPIDPVTGHRVDPRSLLRLAQSLYGATPEAYWILIPGEDFSFGETFSQAAVAGVAIALQKIREKLSTPLGVG